MKEPKINQNRISRRQFTFSALAGTALLGSSSVFASEESIKNYASDLSAHALDR